MLHPRSWLGRVPSLPCNRTQADVGVGAAHLYLLDFVDQHFSSLSKELRTTYPNTHITFVQGDAASSKVISSLVDQVIREQGHLDFFFANAGIAQGQSEAKSSDWSVDDLKKNVRGTEIDDEEFMDVMRINTLRWVTIWRRSPQPMDNPRVACSSQ